MNTIDTYVDAATRENTRRSYRSAVEHFEVLWGGLLPASGDSIARYLAEYGNTLAISTLQQHLAALASWHHDHGFPDPTKTPLVRKVIRGIRNLHPTQQKQARPMQLEAISDIVTWLDQMIELASTHGRRPDALRHTRDRALLLLGFSMPLPRGARHGCCWAFLTYLTGPGRIAPSSTKLAYITINLTASIGVQSETIAWLFFPFLSTKYPM